MTLAGRVDKISSKGDSHAPKIKAEVDLLEAEVASLPGGWPSVVGVSVSGKKVQVHATPTAQQPALPVAAYPTFLPTTPATGLDCWGDLPHCQGWLWVILTIFSSFLPSPYWGDDFVIKFGIDSC